VAAAKNLLVVNGAMGVGKTTTCRLLMDRLQPCAWLDGDWCWTMNPFVVSEPNRAMVLDNIAHVLRSFLANAGFSTVIFSWVIQTDDIFRAVASRLADCEFRLTRITLTCSEAVLRARLERDVAAGLREADVIPRSLERLPLYERMDTIKLDVGAIDARAAADAIVRLVQSGT